MLAFFGSDLAWKNATRYLRRLLESGYVVVALDSSAMAMAAEADVPYVVMDDILEAEAMAHALRMADECDVGWWQPARNDFSVDGVCWPEVDNAMRWFWPDALLALAFADALKQRGCLELRFFGSILPRPAIVNCRSDIWGSLWKAELQGRTKRSALLKLPAYESLRGGFAKMRTRMRKPVSEQNQQAAPSWKTLPEEGLIVVIAPEEEYRFTNVIARLKEHFPGKVAVIIGAPYSGASAGIISTWNVPVLFGPMWPVATGLAAAGARFLPSVDRLLKDRFVNAYRKAARASIGYPWEKPLKHLGYHFEDHCKYRWPFLHKSIFGFWLKLWEKIRPRAVMMTTRGEAALKAAGLAARHLGIRSFGIPHGGVSGFDIKERFPASDMVLCSSVCKWRDFKD